MAFLSSDPACSPVAGAAGQKKSWVWFARPYSLRVVQNRTFHCRDRDMCEKNWPHLECQPGATSLTLLLQKLLPEACLGARWVGGAVEVHSQGDEGAGGVLAAALLSFPYAVGTSVSFMGSLL